jgi:hypothetical protein
MIRRVYAGTLVHVTRRHAFHELTAGAALFDSYPQQDESGGADKKGGKAGGAGLAAGVYTRPLFGST